MLIKHAYGLYKATGAMIIVVLILAGASFFVFTSEEKAKETIVKQTEILEIGDPYTSEGSAIGSASNVFTAQLTNCTIGENEVAITNNERQMFNLINSYRQENGLSPYSLSKNLSVAAAWHSNDMAVRQVMSHTDSLGRVPSARIGDCGYSTSATRGENIAYSTRANDPNQIFEGWKSSSGHNANMLKPTYAAIGIAEWRLNGRSYWTTDFGGSSDGAWDGGSAIEPTEEPTPTISPSITTTISESPTMTVTVSPSIPETPLDPDSVKLQTTLNLEGVGQDTSLGKNPNPTFNGRTITALIYDLNDQQLEYGIGTITYDSQDSAVKSIIQAPYGFLASSSGTLKIKIATQGSLRKSVPGTFTLAKGQSVNLPTIDLTMGDLNGDNELSVADYTILIACMQGNSISNCTTYFADLNYDGKVDEKDLNIFYSGLAKRQGD